MVAAGCGPSDRVGAGRVYAASGLTDQILRFDATVGTALEPISVDRRPGEMDQPHGIAVSPRRDYWYVTLAHGDPTLWKYELGSDRLVGRVSLGMEGASRIGITPDGRRAFVPDYGRSNPARAGRVAVVDLQDLRVLSRPAICPGPHDASVNPAGDRVAITCSLSDEIVILDTREAGVVSRFHVDPKAGLPGRPRFRPLDVVWSPRGDRLFATLAAAGEVRAFGSDGTPLGRVRVGSGPGQLAVTGDGRTLLVAVRGEAALSVLSLPELRETRRVSLGVPHPHGVALSDDGRVLFVTCEGDIDTPGRVIAVDYREGRLLWSRDAGAYTLGIAFAGGS